MTTSQNQKNLKNYKEHKDVTTDKETPLLTEKV